MSSSREELALETQLLLQEVTQATQDHASLEIDVDGAPVESELEVAKQALVAKLMAKKELNRKQRLAVNQKRYGLSITTAAVAGVSVDASVAAKPAAPKQTTPTKLQQRLKMPMAAGAAAPSRKKKELLSKLRHQAIQQGSREIAKLFGYASFEEHVKYLNKKEKMQILQQEMMEQNAAAKKQQEAAGPHSQDDDVEEDDQVVAEDGDALGDDDKNVDMVSPENGAEDESMEPAAFASITTTPKKTSTADATTASTPSQRLPATDVSVPTTRRRRNQIEVDDEDDGNEADSEQDNAKDDDEDGDMDDAEAAAAKTQRNKDKAAGFRRLLEAEAQQNRLRKRLAKSGGDFMELEAEEDEEEDALKIAGLGDFGFGVPQAKTQESKEAEEEKRALNLREDDLEGIVDELSDDERTQERDLDEIFRKEQEDQDQQRVKEVIRNVKEGFGRNRRAFSAGLGLGSEARGRFNLNELVAADGSKLEAARLGLLESDEELSDGDSKSRKKKKRGDGEEGEEEDEEEEEEDEEAEMERMLRERYQNQPKIYMTSSESEDEDEQEITTANADGAGDDAASDEERERQQMKLFSERARINRRMARMKDLQRQESQESQDIEAAAPTQTAIPNLLLEEDEDSQEVRYSSPIACDSCLTSLRLWQTVDEAAESNRRGQFLFSCCWQHYTSHSKAKRSPATNQQIRFNSPFPVVRHHFVFASVIVLQSRGRQLQTVPKQFGALYILISDCETRSLQMYT